MREARTVFHPAVVNEDLPRLAALFPDRFSRVWSQILAAVAEIKASQGVPGRDMRPPYQGWYRKKFFSSSAPPPSMRADLRIIYQFTDDGSELRILAVGKRLPGDAATVPSLAGA